jgi:hypothetical protein
VKVSPGIEQEDPSSHRGKSWRERLYGKKGFSCRYLLGDLEALRKNPWGNKMLV